MYPHKSICLLASAGAILFSSHSSALDYSCFRKKTNIPPQQVEQVDHGEFVIANGLIGSDLKLDDLFRLYPRDTDLTRVSGELLLSTLPNQQQRAGQLPPEINLVTRRVHDIHANRKIVGRRIMLVSNDFDMSSCVESTPPMGGYVSKASVGRLD
jgi:hypothetical protein